MIGHRMLSSYMPSVTQREMADWEHEIVSHKKFLRITPKNKDLFYALLGKEADIDSYAISPTYYALTGRKGLWVYQDNNSYVPLCWHPNIDGQILIFPPRGEINDNIMQRLLAEMPIPPIGARIARIKKHRSPNNWLNNLQNASDRVILTVPVEELVLDWRYPVRILSTEAISKMQGHAFMRIRNHFNQAVRYNITVEPLALGNINQIISFVYRWANHRAHNANTLENLMGPYRAILNLLNDDSYNLHGLVFSIAGHIQGVTIWEMPKSKDGVANSWVNLINTEYKGLSEYMMRTLAQSLLSQGVSFFNLGGSETKGLDDYKKKYLPAYSVALRSTEVVIEGNDPVLEALIKFRTSRVAA